MAEAGRRIRDGSGARAWENAAKNLLNGTQLDFASIGDGVGECVLDLEVSELATLGAGSTHGVKIGERVLLGVGSRIAEELRHVL